MGHYQLYHQGNLLLKFVAGPGVTGILPIHFYGISHINLDVMNIYMQCPLEDVRVEQDGVPLELTLLHTIDDFASYALKEPEQGA